MHLSLTLGSACGFGVICLSPDWVDGAEMVLT